MTDLKSHRERAHSAAVNSDGLRLESRTWNVMLVVCGAVLVLCYSSPLRPIWMDELLHFAVGGMSFVDALRTIDYTTIEVNHGQTGTYILIDWFLLNVFGAQAWALRLPSLLSTGLLLWSAVLFMRSKHLGRFWEVLVLLGLVGHSFLMSFAADARPYMPLVASAVAMLTYFSADPDLRLSIPYRVIGVLGVLSGALMHAYWLFFLVFALGFTALFQGVRAPRRLSRRDLAAFTSWKLIGAGIALYFICGQLTWMRQSTNFGYDAFYMVGGAAEGIERFRELHFTGGSPVALWWILLVGTALAIALGLRSWRHWSPPLVLFLTGCLSSVALAAISTIRGYWIFERQWVAGIALVSIATTWLFAELWKMTTVTLWLRIVIVSLYILGVALSLTSAVSWVTAATQTWALSQVEFRDETASAADLMAGANDEVAIFGANVNISRGGPVWREFTSWYRGQAGMRQEFRDTNPSWTEKILGPNDWGALASID